jgi:hypothetical protein
MLSTKDLLGISSHKGKVKKDAKDTVHPVKPDFWEQFRVDFGWTLYHNSIGNQIAVFERTNELIFRVITHVERDKSKGNVTKFVEELTELLKPILDHLKQAMYKSVELYYEHEIGLADLKQQTIYPMPTGEFYIVSSGFDEPIPMEIYHSMKTIALNYAYDSLMQSHAIFHLLVHYTTPPSSIKEVDEEDKEKDEYTMLKMVYPDFWKQFDYEYSWIIYDTNLGIKHKTARKTYYLASKIVEYQKLDSNFNSELDELEDDLDDDDKTRIEIKKLVDELPELLIELRKAMYNCISLSDRDIGLMSLRQISLFPNPHGEMFVVCDGFSQVIPLSIYTHMIKIITEITMPVINKIHAVFQELLMVERSILPDDFPVGPQLITDDEFEDTDEEDDD